MLNRGGFDAKATDMSSKAASLVAAGATPGERVEALAEERAKAKGAFSMVVAVGAASALAPIALTAAPPAADILALLPALPPASMPAGNAAVGGVAAAAEAIDPSALLHLGPACTRFARPVRLCMFVGDTSAGFSRSVKVTSQLDCNDPARGYGPYEAASDVSFDRATGQVCGYVSHFSVAVVTLVGSAGTPTVDKHAAAGSSCPRGCSGRGVCRAEGLCMCQLGWSGADCGARACPAAPSWDVASSGVVHATAACSARGSCDTTRGVCACYDGYEGAACERSRCPGGGSAGSCSGHGRCRTQDELPSSAAGGGSGATAGRRVQACVCDAGFSGPDCASRTCPLGGDPEEAGPVDGGGGVVAASGTVHVVTLDFGVLPPSTGGVLPPAALAHAELALRVTRPGAPGGGGGSVLTHRVPSVLDPAGGGTDALAGALRSLPGAGPAWAAGITVTGDSPTPGSVRYAVTFDAGVAAPGPTAALGGAAAGGGAPTLSCPFNRDGVSLGCATPGCQPAFRQPVLLELPPAAASGGIALNASLLLQQPAALADGDDAVPARWGVTVTLTIRAGAPGSPHSRTYAAASTLYEAGAAGSLPETPLPPAGLRLGVPLLYGLSVDFDADDTGVVPGDYAFKWRLPACRVGVLPPAPTGAAAPPALYECGRRGRCAAATGECQCFNGYEGYACSVQGV